MTSRGILPDFPLAPGAWALASLRSDVIDPSHPIAAAITALAARCKVERQRVELAQDLADILGPDIEFEKDRLLGSEKTRQTYLKTFERFCKFCEKEDLPALPTNPETVAAYIVTRAGDGASIKALERDVAAVLWAHEQTDRGMSFDGAFVRGALRWARRNRGTGDKATEPPPPEQPDLQPVPRESVDA